jgi:hypothetical protein
MGLWKVSFMFYRLTFRLTDTGTFLELEITAQDISTILLFDVFTSTVLSLRQNKIIKQNLEVGSDADDNDFN